MHGLICNWVERDAFQDFFVGFIMVVLLIEGGASRSKDNYWFTAGSWRPEEARVGRRSASHVFHQSILYLYLYYAEPDCLCDFKFLDGK